MSDLLIASQAEGQDQGIVSYRKLGSGKRKILFFHGFPGSSLQIQVFEKWILSHDLEVICFDRPGYNRTKPRSGSAIAASAEISKELVSQLNWEQCEVISVSGGTPSALSFVGIHQDLVTRVTVISGLPPLQDPDIHLHIPKISLCAMRLLPLIPGRLIRKTLEGGRKSSDSSRAHRMLNIFLPSSEADKTVFSDESVRSVLQQSLFEALHQDAQGPKMDVQIFLSNWDQQLQPITQPIHFWHGEEDRIISHRIAHRFSQRFPNSIFKLIENEGHFSLPVQKLGEILEF